MDELLFDLRSKRKVILRIRVPALLIPISKLTAKNIATLFV